MEFTFEAIGTNTFLTYMADIEEFDEFSMKMLEHNEIEGILPFSYLQENRKKKIRYAITSYETLESYIRRPLSLPKILNILESIARTALELEEYMLYMNGIVLEPSYMYTEIGTGKTRLVYLPVKNTGNIDVFGFLRNLLGTIQYEAPENAVCILRISNDINSGKITGLEQLLTAIRDAEGDRGKIKIPQTDSPVIHQKTDEKPEPVWEPEPVQYMPVMQQPIKAEEEKTKEEKPKEKGKKSFGLFGGEKKEKEKAKPKKKKQDAKMISPGFAIPGMGPEITTPPVADAAEIPVSSEIQGGKKGFSGFKKKAKTESAPAVRKGAFPMEAPLMNIPAYPLNEEKKLDFGKTIISQPDDEVTVVEGCGENPGQHISYILRRANGQKMYLEQNITKIGRESAYVDFYIGDKLQIGRSHAEIIRRGQDFFIKDNNSKNHTYVNGRMVVGEELVQLKAGDTITLANEVFEYHEI